MPVSGDASVGFSREVSGSPWPSWNITLDASANLIIVQISSESSAVSSVTIGGQSLSPITNGSVTAVNGNTNRLDAYFLLDPPTGTQGIVIAGPASGYAHARSYIAAADSMPRAFSNNSAAASSLSATATGCTDGSMFLTGMVANIDTDTTSPVGADHNKLFSDSGSSSVTSCAGAYGEKGPVSGTSDQELGWSAGSSTRIAVLTIEILSGAPAEPVYEQTSYQFFNDDGAGLGEAP